MKLANYMIGYLGLMLSNNRGTAGLTGDQIALYTKDMYEAAREGYQRKPVRYPEIFKVKSGVTGGGDKSTQILGAGDLDEHTTEDQDIQFESPVQGWQYWIVYRTFSKGVPFSKNAVVDTVKLGNLLKDYAETWGISVRNKKETDGAKIFDRGGYTDGDAIFDGSWGDETDANGDLVYDGFPLFNLTGNPRATKGGGTYFNAVTGLALDPDNFETIYNIATATNNRDERDRVIENDVDTLLTRDGADHFTAKRILESELAPNGELNDINVYRNIVKPLKWAYLADNAWYVGKAKHPSYQWDERQKPEIRFYRREENRGYRATIDVRWGIVIKDFRVWTRANGTYGANPN